MWRNPSVIAVDVEQRSPEWFRARVGRLTGSRAADATSFLKNGRESAARRDYRCQLVAERLTGCVEPDAYVSEAMQHGIDTEPLARAAYQAATGELVQTVGFLTHQERLVGCSLDGVVCDGEGIIEIKCPKTATHLEYLRLSTVPQDYVPQIVHNLWVSGAAWCDFMSFDSRLPAPLQTHIIRLHRSEAVEAAYVTQAEAFLEETEALYQELQDRMIGGRHGDR